VLLSAVDSLGGNLPDSRLFPLFESGEDRARARESQISLAFSEFFAMC